MGIMGYADPKSESWAESAARAHIIMEGFALPKLQVPFEQPLNPGHVYYVDMLFMRADGSQVIGEVDGLEKYWNPAMLAGRSTARVLANEQHRESELTMYGMPVMRISFDDIMHPAQLYEKLSATTFRKAIGPPKACGDGRSRLQAVPSSFPRCLYQNRRSRNVLCRMVT